MDAELIQAIRNKNKAYSEYFQKWLMVEKAKHSATPPTQKQLEEVQRYYDAYQEMILIFQNKLQETHNVTSNNYSNGQVG